jgi:tRNA-binding protein
MTTPTLAEFVSLDLRVGTVVRCESNDMARDPALAIWIDFGTEGIKLSSAQITELYEPEALVGTQVVAATGFPPLKVGGFVSEVLVIGAMTDGGVVLLRPDRPVEAGAEIA